MTLLSRIKSNSPVSIFELTAIKSLSLLPLSALRLFIIESVDVGIVNIVLNPTALLNVTFLSNEFLSTVTSFSKISLLS